MPDPLLFCCASAWERGLFSCVVAALAESFHGLPVSLVVGDSRVVAVIHAD